MRRLILFFSSLVVTPIFAQEEIPCYALFINPDDLYTDLLNDSLGFWFVPNRDTTVLVYFSNDRRTYKHFRRPNMQLLVDGGFGGRIYTDSHSRFGKWTEYYDNGIIKVTGYYYEDQPIGLWQHYYPNGKPKESYTISLIEAEPSSSFCKIGSYQSFYPNGNLKINGYYRASVDSTTEIRNDEINGGTYIVQVRKPISKPYGIWVYYNEDGSIEKEEEFEEDINPFIWYYPRR